ncbi:hypothetical protein H072_2541 [Dactylellina haptotyla CBS 200.50]|uniref:Atos-like conserved domain-containing protein n=1 Tax=Dactylellina haptotyla (strain CBS 200.50) TaxID=1284197 RepID=S8C708_DACHA|nr:hypothetical protein H072_2541 [Dactylellina haptotyla CBS 200.50]
MPLVYNTHPSPPAPPTAPAGGPGGPHMHLVGGGRDGAADARPDLGQESEINSTVENAPNNRAELIRRLKAREARIWSLNTNALEIDPKSDPKETDDSSDSHSALHSGVFAPDSRQLQHPPSPINSHFHNPFHNARNPYSEVAPTVQHSSLFPYAQENHARAGRSRAQSLSGYVLKHPTSPLALSSSQAETGSIDEISNPIDILDAPLRARRASLVPSISSLYSSQSGAPQSYSRHASRRSISDNWYDSFPVAPSHSRQSSRRLSFGVGLGGDLPVGSFVGSYEESILNGRMSTTPSKPLQFLAQIGVLGLGKCKASLRCPTHVTVPFPAYFYSVGDYDSPSPYVGQIDLDTALQSQSKPSKTFPEGGYRIPPKGQLQIIIKNPNKTAVKLFLVPYDLTDMQPGQKTFIRQKSYSADAYIDTLTKPGNVPMTPITAQKMRDKEREALRYLIHLHLCCPSKGRYYLHRNIRLVFANRVPDGKEKLRNELHQPEPKYSPWKPGPDSMNTPRRRRGSSISFSLAAEEFMLSENARQRMTNFKFGGGGGPIIAVGDKDEEEDEPPMSMPIQARRVNTATAMDADDKDEDGDVSMADDNASTVTSGSWDKLSLCSIASSRSDSSQHGLLAMKLKGVKHLVGGNDKNRKEPETTPEA